MSLKDTVAKEGSELSFGRRGSWLTLGAGSMFRLSYHWTVSLGKHSCTHQTVVETCLEEDIAKLTGHDERSC